MTTENGYKRSSLLFLHPFPRHDILVISITELIYCREDVYSFLQNKIQLKYGADLSGIAYDIKEQVRKGIYSHKAMPEDIEKLLYESEVPRWYIESMKKIRYLFPKTQLIAALKREICNIK